MHNAPLHWLVAFLVRGGNKVLLRLVGQGGQRPQVAQPGLVTGEQDDVAAVASGGLGLPAGGDVVQPAGFGAEDRLDPGFGASLLEVQVSADLVVVGDGDMIVTGGESGLRHLQTARTPVQKRMLAVVMESHLAPIVLSRKGIGRCGRRWPSAGNVQRLPHPTRYPHIGWSRPRTGS
jgi:hypothetical protein